jgi:hypothetical protein
MQKERNLCYYVECQDGKLNNASLLQAFNRLPMVLQSMLRACLQCLSILGTTLVPDRLALGSLIFVIHHFRDE